MRNSNYIWTAGPIALVIMFVALAIFMRPQIQSSVATTISTNATSSSQQATSTETHDGVTGTGSFEVSKEDIPTLVVPDFRAPLKISPEISADVKLALQKNFATLVEILAKDSFDLKSWIDLGTIRKMGGDYKGAETAWLFVTKGSPTNTVAYSNLADLYMNFLKDYPKSEAMYLKVISLNPTDASAYRDLASLYDNLYKKGTGAGEAILKKGVAAAPDSVDLHVVLARYYKEAGRTAEAKVQYEAAIAAAQKAGQTEVAAQLKTEAGL